MSKPKKEQVEDRLLTAAEVAAIWNEMAKEMGYKTDYDRFSVAARRTRGKKSFVPDLETPIGKLYRESRARSVKLYPKEKQRISKDAEN